MRDYSKFDRKGLDIEHNYSDDRRFEFKWICIICIVGVIACIIFMIVDKQWSWVVGGAMIGCALAAGFFGYKWNWYINDLQAIDAEIKKRNPLPLRVESLSVGESSVSLTGSDPSSFPQ